MLTYLKHMALAAAAALCAAPAAQAADQPQEWELINPTGEIEKVAVEPAKRITALEARPSPCAGTARTTAIWCSTALPNCWPRSIPPPRS